jgi:cytochrome c
MRTALRITFAAAPMLLGLSACFHPAVNAAGPDAQNGKAVFERRCSGCHAADISKEGPPLRGVVGRQAGTVAGFQYSDALRASALTWNESLLLKWLENPDALVKGTDMEFRVVKPEERDAAVAYLKSLTK